MSNTKLISRFGLPAAAIGLLGFAVFSSLKPARPQEAPPIPPAQGTASGQVAGIGVVEPQSEFIDIATELPGVVREIAVKPGDRVEKGQILFRLDTRAQSASLAAARANVQLAEVALADERQRLTLFQSVPDKRAISGDELARREFAVKRAEAQLQAARAEATRIATDLERLSVRAPISGRVYRVNIRPGEFAPAGPTPEPLISMGEDDVLHVRVEIDEADIARVSADAAAVGRLRGQTSQNVRLTFVRFEPQATEKRALAGGAERVDTRVIEAIYAFDPDAAKAFLGQRMDVFIAAAPLKPPAKADAKS